MLHQIFLAANNLNLYSYFIILSEDKNYVLKNEMPSVVNIGKLLFGCRQTYYNHLKMLIQNQLIIEQDDRYIIQYKDEILEYCSIDELKSLLKLKNKKIISFFLGSRMLDIDSIPLADFCKQIGQNLNGNGENYKKAKTIIQYLKDNNFINVVLNNNTELIELPQKKQEGFVYIIKMDKFYKIGRTKQFKQRLGEYTKLPLTPEIILCEYCGAMYGTIEKELHEKYKEYNTNGEWFLLDDTQIVEIKKYIIDRIKND